MKPSFCRVCPNSCPILVEVDDGRAVRVTGDPASEVYQGYTCVKGRALPELHNHPERLLHSQKRMPDGSYAPISSEQLLDELAERIGGVARGARPEHASPPTSARWRPSAPSSSR